MTPEAAVRPIAPAEAEAYRALMLEAYGRHPDAFTSSVEERSALPLSWWVARLSDAASHVVGGYVSGQLVAAAGCSAEARGKSRHKATVFGMYVSTGHGGRGLGRAMLEALIAEARRWPGLRVLQLTVTEGNDSAIALYEHAGFVRWGREACAIVVDGREHAKLHYARRLDGAHVE